VPLELLITAVVYFSERVSVPPQNLRPLSLSDKTIITKQNQIENNGFRFRYWIHRCSHSISRRLFNHPMYAPFTKINIYSISYISNLWLIWLQIGLCWRSQKKSFLGLLWVWVFFFLSIWLIWKCKFNLCLVFIGIFWLLDFGNCRLCLNCL
jgi:hypothetical protein